ncbi:MAG: hypothetical protein V7L23_25515 [Nostoc sp.]|uniref:hypothetical protein n=1 Tax=Nostoc sp. TaxID=1180 RepID=UPI002FF40FAB
MSQMIKEGILKELSRGDRNAGELNPHFSLLKEGIELGRLNSPNAALRFWK